MNEIDILINRPEVVDNVELTALVNNLIGQLTTMTNQRNELRSAFVTAYSSGTYDETVVNKSRQGYYD
jgi:hypothetical protein